jgi:hypothetical protein
MSLLGTLNGAIEDILEILAGNDITGLEEQTDFIAQALSAWFEASGRFEDPKKKMVAVSGENVVYQGRILVSIITLVPAMIWILKKKKITLISRKAQEELTLFLKGIAERANLLDKGVFIDKDKFKERGYLGSGGIGRFRDSLWATVLSEGKLSKKVKPETIAAMAVKTHDEIITDLGKE